MSKYDPLWKWIKENGTDSFKLTYAEIEEIDGVWISGRQDIDESRNGSFRESGRIMLANVMTGCRILFSAIIFLVPVFSPVFYGCYLVAGCTDMIDGTIARKLGTESEFVSKFDTIADIVFIVAAAYKMLPVMEIPKGIWIWIGVIALIKIISIISGFVIAKQFVSVHTVANKITGLLMFLLPLTMEVVELRYSALVVCMVATFAAIQEGHFIRIGKVE